MSFDYIFIVARNLEMAANSISEQAIAVRDIQDIFTQTYICVCRKGIFLFYQGIN